ncbi:Predicted ATPase [Actinokineospora alba]|uniref:Predicted ATPase n=1 Tax=Actinokineospora alba TaxID=504798 RepID=A0A1H0F1N6_9PSEU|nr:LuxR C-terminal-related transcriptional regulator [Actinokineospora alba]TDP69305.1 LuxR family transcriptional regulator [Actinokineospora alba]SDI19705.1 Predicted ATPase [Actinokineospora alba]SDN88542.1 Predicted ATPase [Actinokineospora alba]
MADVAASGWVPELVALREAPHNLAAELSSFVGRERELAELTDAIAGTRMLTLTGAGGCGKSRVAHRVGRALLPRFPDGVWWVGLATLSGRDELEQALAHVIGVRPAPGRRALDSVAAHLASRRVLLIMDNCEHVLDEAARVAETLVGDCPGVTVLATSREPLRTDGETDWRVPSLSLPTAAPAESDAVRLFVERARQVRPGFQLDDANADAVARICRELDGIPLAIELAATRLRMLSVDQLADALGERFRVLTDGTRTSLTQHRTLRASVDWSHDLLSDAERTLLRRLGVFRGGFTLDAATRVCAGDRIQAGAVFELLAALVDKSLVQAEDHGPVVRYRLLETIRQYALERLAAAGETDRVLDRHRDAYLALAEDLAPKVNSPRQLEVLGLLDPEAANFVQAIDRAAAGESETALWLCVALTGWWQGRGRFGQGLACLRTALAASDQPSVPRVRALWGRAFLLALTGEFADALPVAQQVLTEAEQLSDLETVGRTRWLLGMLVFFPAPADCREQLERSLELATAHGDTYGAAVCAMSIAYSYLHQNDLRQAEPWSRRAMRQAQAVGQLDLIAWCHGATAWAHHVRAEFDLCRREALAAIRCARSIGDIMSEISATCAISQADVGGGHPERALERLTAARQRALSLGAGFILPAAVACTGWAHAAQGRLDEAAACLEDLIREGAGGYSYALGFACAGLAEVYRLRGERADEVGGRALELAVYNGDRLSMAATQLTLGRVAGARGEWAQAQRTHHEALSVVVADGYAVLLPSALEALAEDAAGLGRPLDATRILAAAASARTALGVVDWLPRREQTAALSDRLRTELGDEPHAAATTEGARLSADEAVAFVSRARGARKRPADGWESLTPTELDVARHAADGLTNPQIAERMFITRGTVKSHLAHIYAKLGLRNRAELAAELARRT